MCISTVPPKLEMSSTATAKAVLRNRALQCSFSSVFHIKKAAGNSAKAMREAREAENIFLKAVGAPMVFMGAVGGVSWLLKD